MHSSGKTPLIRLAKRDGMAGAGQWGIRIAAILLALVVGGLVILLSGNNPIQGYAIISSPVWPMPMRAKSKRWPSLLILLRPTTWIF